MGSIVLILIVGIYLGATFILLALIKKHFNEDFKENKEHKIA